MEVTPILETVAAYPRPTIAKVQGYCLGAGLEFALACDMRVATNDSQFGFPEIGLGLIPGGGGTQRAVRMLGEGRAKELVFRGSFIDASRAADWGLINRAVETDDLEAVIDEYVEDVLSGPPIALRVAKRLIDDGQDASLDTALSMESQGFGLLIGTDDAGEGIEAFQEKRDAQFEGR
jgi:enoyl-CoA hydratase/3-hydroxyacyl-CoA dehydrogenase